MAALTPRHPGALSPHAQALLGRLAERPWSDDFYLAGSAALALYTGHRPVRDLDLMAGTNRLTSPERRDLLGDLLALEPATEVETARDGYLYVRVAGEAIQGTGIRFFYYPYPLADPFQEFAGFPVISAVDLGLMKLGAIISRGTRRDFVDLYMLCRELPLAGLLERADDKFGHVRDFPLQALKGLADLSVAAEDPMPCLALPLEWEEVESWVLGQVRDLGRSRFGMEALP
ncbi:MAG TPA: nucleotidyl transferase AbiEii/AbiGii toxin family protein [Thermoanaerobaculia bacterium]|nr:nucleotidyl transferase AbiEii/AbiGii toxin family protein [Thermoanaerobaculia bacterium]